MQPGDTIQAHGENWILLQLLYAADGVQYALAVQEDTEYPSDARIICFEST